MTWPLVAAAGIAAIPPTIAAIAALLAARRSAAAVEATKKEIADKLIVTDQKLGVVHELVNSRLTAALDKIDRLEAKLQALTGKAPSGDPPPTALPNMDKPTDLIPRREK